MSDRRGRVYLVGAGPGAFDLITLRGADCLKQADCVIYDYLVNPDLLQLAPAGAELIYAGKKGGKEKSIEQNALNALVESRLFIDDTAGISLAEMRAKARRLKQQAGALDLVVVDYLQLMTATLPANGGKRYENRTQEVSAISRGLKALAKELHVPVVALSQLSRASERRGDDKRPMLSDLRESGSIEQDADVVMFIHREAYYNRDEEMSDADKAKSEIIISKQRNGPTGVVHLNFISRFTRFDNPDQGHEFQ